MIEVLEDYLKDLMRTFKEFGILDPDGNPFEPENYQFEQLKEFNLDLSSEEMKNHWRLPFYNPECDGISENQQLRTQIEESNYWVKATDHPYTTNVGKAIWNRTLRIVSLAKQGTKAYLDKDIKPIFSMFWYRSNHEAFLNANSAYLDNSDITEDKAKEFGIQYYVIPKVVDEKTLAFAECTVKLMEKADDLIEQFNLIKKAVEAVIPKSMADYFFKKIYKTTVGMQISLPRLLDRINTYKARISKWNQNNEQRQELQQRMRSLKDLAIATRQKYPAGLSHHIEATIRSLDKKKENNTFEHRLTIIEALIKEIRDTDYLFNLEPEFLFDENYLTSLYVERKPESELITRIDLEIKREFETTQQGLFHTQNSQDIAAIKRSLIQRLENLREDYRFLDKNNAATLLREALKAKQDIEEEKRGRHENLLNDENEFQQFDRTQSDKIKTLKEELKILKENLDKVGAKIADKSSIINSTIDGAINLGKATWKAGSNLFNFLRPSAEEPEGTAAQKKSPETPVEDNNTENLEDLKQQHLQMSDLFISTEKQLQDLEGERATITAKIVCQKLLLNQLDKKETEYLNIIQECRTNVLEKTNEFATHIQKFLRELENLHEAPLKPKCQNFREFQTITTQRIAALKTLKDSYDRIKNAAGEDYISEELKRLYTEFDTKYASDPLTETHLQEAIELLVNDYQTRNSGKHSILAKKSPLSSLNIMNRKTLIFANSLLTAHNTFINKNSTPAEKMKAITRFQRLCNSISLPKQTRIVAGIFLGVLLGIVIGLCLISGIGAAVAGGILAVLTATLIIKAAAVTSIAALTVTGVSIGYAIGDSTTHKVSKSYQKIGFLSRTAIGALEVQTKAIPAVVSEQPAQSRDDESENSSDDSATRSIDI